MLTNNRSRARLGLALVLAVSVLMFGFAPTMRIALADTDSAVVTTNPTDSVSSAPASDTATTVDVPVTTAPTTDTTEPVVTTDSVVAPTDSSSPTDSTVVTADSSATDTTTATTTTVVAPAVVAPTTTVTDTVAPQLTTDKPDYNPGQTASIFGKFFASLQNIVLKIFGGSTTDNTYTESIQNVTADATGAFTTTYTLDNIFRPLYTVVASDTSGSTLAQTTFADPVTGAGDLDQTHNGGTVGTNPISPVEWVNGNAGKTNSHYAEGDSIPYRIVFTGLPTGNNFVDIEWDTKHSGGVAIDYITSPDRISELVQPLDGVAGSPTGPNPFTIPAPVGVNIPGTVLLAGLPASSAALLPVGERQMDIYNGTISSIVYLPPTGDFADAVNVSSQRARITFNASASTVVLSWGGHIASRLEWGFLPDGTPRSAGGINGSPYHTRFIQLCNGLVETQQACGGGNQDRSLSADAIIVPNTITVHKVTSPAGGTGFGFTDTGGLTPATFSLNDGGTQTFSPGPGSYTVVENSPLPTYALTNLVCTATGTGTSATPTIGTRTASITIGSAGGGNVDCIYTNTLQTGHLIVQKTTIPAADPTSFAITASGTGTITAPAASTVTDALDHDYTVTAGTYSVAETVPTGWDKTGDTCQNVVVAAGQTATCLLTNTKRGTITIVKDAVPNDAQDFAFADNFGNGNPATFSLDDDSNATLPNTRDFEVLSGSGFSVSETIPTGWKQFSATCSDGSPVSNINVAAGEHVTCTFVNHKLATIVLVKHAIGGNDSFNFATTGGSNLPANPSLLTIGNWATSTFSNIDPDLTYSIAETPVPPGWVLIGSSCSGANTPASLTPNNGETVTCTFTNAQPDARITLSPLSATNGINQPHTITATVQQNAGAGLVNAPDGTLVTFSLANNTAGAAFVGGINTCTTTAGACSVSINAATAGGVDIHAVTIFSVLGLSLTRASGDGLSGDSANAHKTYVDANLQITPATATNRVGDPHTLTGHVNVNTGTGGYVNAPDGTVINFGLVSGPGLLSPPSCPTAGSTGSCSVTLTSNTTGTTVINASTTVVVGGVALSRSTGDTNVGDSSNAQKNWVNARITITPATSTNEVGNPHTFVVEVDQDTGAGFVPVPAGTLANAIASPAPTSLDVSDCNDGVNASGQCNVIINSNTAGVFTITARSTVVVGGLTFQLQTNGLGANSGPAIKTYVDAKISLSPLTATNNIGSPHTITATVQQNAGAGLVNAPDGTLVTFSLLNNAAGAAFVGGINTCTTTAGSCSVQINSATPGSVDIHATTTFLVGGISLTRASDGTHGSTGDANKLYVAGGLEITKVASTGAYPFNVTEDFTVKVTGPSYPSGTNLVFHLVNNVITNPTEGLTNLIPGSYSFEELGPTPTGAWTVTSQTGNLNVIGNATSTATVTNTLKQPHTTIHITPNTFETVPGENVILTITDINDGAVPLANPAVILTYGATTVTLDKTHFYVSGDTNDDGIMDPGETWTWSYSVIISADTTFAVAGHGADLFGNDISPTNGYTAESGSITVTTIGTTRTLGFWQTHTDFTSYVFGLPGMQQYVGAVPSKGPITNVLALGQSQLFGGFYAPMAKTTTGVKRSPIDQARINLLQQLLAAKLNCAAFGCSTATQTLIAQADADYAAGVSKNVILADSGALDTFNNSGDNNAIPAGLPATGKATPKTSQSYANLVFWNTP